MEEKSRPAAQSSHETATTKPATLENALVEAVTKALEDLGHCGSPQDGGQYTQGSAVARAVAKRVAAVTERCGLCVGAACNVHATSPSDAGAVEVDEGKRLVFDALVFSFRRLLQFTPFLFSLCVLFNSSSARLVI